MSEWVRQWEITILYERPRGPIGTTRYSTVVDTVAELRALVEQARADPNAWHIRYGSVRRQVGESPTHCPRGHDLRSGGSVNSSQADHLDCECGGHGIDICGRCRSVVIDPPPGPECLPRLRPGQRLPAAWRG